VKKSNGRARAKNKAKAFASSAATRLGVRKGRNGALHCHIPPCSPTKQALYVTNDSVLGAQERATHGILDIRNAVVIGVQPRFSRVHTLGV
jgi:hypothetical protein